MGGFDYILYYKAEKTIRQPFFLKSLSKFPKGLVRQLDVDTQAKQLGRQLETKDSHYFQAK